MAFISTEEEYNLEAEIEDDDYLDECLGCETGVDYMGAHLGKDGLYHPFCCTNEAEIERMTIQVNAMRVESK